MKLILQKIKVFINTKFVFTKPNSSNFLIFDQQSLRYLKLIIKDNFEIYYTRGEVLNIYVFFYTLIYNGVETFRKNYKLNYFKLVNPKFIITTIDENYHFYLLKDQYKNPKYISFQRALKTHEFFLSIKKMKKKNKNLKFKSDFIFVLGSNDKKEYSKLIDGKIYVSGNFLNNKFNRIISPTKKISEICFISSKKKLEGEVNKHEDYQLFKLLHKFCKKKKIKLMFLSKSSLYEKKYFQLIYNFDGWKYFPNKNRKFTYDTINKSQLVVFSTTTLGHEAISKGKKGICMTQNFPYKNYHTNYKKTGFYWNNKIDNKTFNKYFNFVLRTNQKYWLKKTKHFKSKIIKYDPSNHSNFIILKKIFGNNFNKFFKID